MIGKLVLIIKSLFCPILVLFDENTYKKVQILLFKNRVHIVRLIKLIYLFLLLNV